MSKAVLHVVPHEQGWGVKREGNERASSTHATQKDAIEAARELAKEFDDIVIHRPDGTIRERVTYSGGATNGQSAADSGPRPKDMESVGTRVRWSAVAAGAVVGLALYVLLNLLAFAVGLSTMDNMTGRTFAITAAVVSAAILLVSVFLGGFIASRTTVGEQPSESMIYGVLVWGTMVLVLLAGGLGLGFGAYAGLRPDAAAAGRAGPVDRDTLKRELNWSDQQADQYVAVVNKSQAVSERVSPRELAWWTFGGAGLSLLAAIGGGLAGAGPQMVMRELRGRRIAPVAVPQAT